MSTHSAGIPGMSPAQAFRLVLSFVLAGAVAVLAASVDPWLLVVLAGLAVTAYAVLERSDDDWILAL